MKLKFWKFILPLPFFSTIFIANSCDKQPTKSLVDKEYDNAAAKLLTALNNFTITNISTDIKHYSVDLLRNLPAPGDKKYKYLKFNNVVSYLKDNFKITNNQLDVTTNTSSAVLGYYYLRLFTPTPLPTTMIGSNNLPVFFNSNFVFNSTTGAVDNSKSNVAFNFKLMSAAYLQQALLTNLTKAPLSKDFLSDISKNGLNKFYQAFDTANFLNSSPSTTNKYESKGGDFVNLSDFNFLQSDNKNVELNFTFMWSATPTFIFKSTVFGIKVSS